MNDKLSAEELRALYKKQTELSAWLRKLDEEDYDDGLDPEEEEDYSDCGWTPGGGCALAGSEECDFECPNRDSMIAELDRKAKS